MAWKSQVTSPFESIPDPDEEMRQIEEIATLTIRLLERRYPAPNAILRAVHPKSHGCLHAQFEVLKDVAKEHQVGLFAHPGAAYDAVIRFSNADTFVREDLRGGENGSRGMAKILDVPGAVLYDDAGRSVQDFLMINTPQFAFANVADYLRLQRILWNSVKEGQEPDTEDASAFFAPLMSGPPSDPMQLAEFVRTKQTLDVLKDIKRLPVANPLEVPYFGAAPILFGQDRVMRISVCPQGPEKDQVVPSNPSGDYLREALEATMSGLDDVVFDVRIQVRQAGEPDLFIEDATKHWSDTEHPWHVVARLKIPAPQASMDPEECDQLFFTPWHALAEHQPLGGINRLRKQVYFASADRRCGTHQYPREQPSTE